MRELASCLALLIFTSPCSALRGTHFEDSGAKNAPVVVLIHGVSGPSTVWDETAPALVEAGFRVIRYDLYGRGRSDRRVGARHDLDLYVAQLEDLLAQRGIDRPVALTGSSFGAIIAAEFALRRPGRVKSLLLIGPAGFPIEAPFLARLSDVPLLGDILFALFAERTILEQNRKYFVGEPPQPFWSDFRRQLEIPGTKEAMRDTMRYCPVQDYLDSYRRLRLPVRVIWGAKDATFPYAHSKALLEALPQAALTRIDDAAHVPQLERPALVNRALIEALR